MESDIFLDLAVEKVRIDFGDFLASLFRIISTNNSCFFDQLISIFSQVPYKILRIGIITLFQYNLVLFENFKSRKNNFDQKIYFTKVSSVISEAIYRIRYPRFISLVEFDYGLYGGSILRSLLNYGQFYLSVLKNFFLFQSTEIGKKIEDILIHMARDKLIIQSNVASIIKTKIFLFDCQKFHFNFHNKPITNFKLSPWKILTKTFNSRLKLNILFSLIQEYQTFQTKHLMKFYMSKMISINVSSSYDILFSIDSVFDFCKDSCAHILLNERFIISSIENPIFIEQSIELKKIFFKFNLTQIQTFFREKFMENLFINQFGKKFGIIFKILSTKKVHEEREILNKSGFKNFQTKAILYHMHRMGFIFIEDSDISKKIPRDIRFWKLDLSIVSKKLIICIVKSLYNLLVRLENHQWIIKKIFETINQKFYQNPKLNIFLNKVKIIMFSIIRLDEILNILYL
jgi:hypothetical protein